MLSNFYTRIKLELSEIKTIVFGPSEGRQLLVATACSVADSRPGEVLVNLELRDAFVALFEELDAGFVIICQFYTWHIKNIDRSENKIIFLPKCEARRRWRSFLTLSDKQ